MPYFSPKYNLAGGLNLRRNVQLRARCKNYRCREGNKKGKWLKRNNSAIFLPCQITKPLISSARYMSFCFSFIIIIIIFYAETNSKQLTVLLIGHVGCYSTWIWINTCMHYVLTRLWMEATWENIRWYMSGRFSWLSDQRSPYSANSTNIIQAAWYAR